MTTAPMPKKAPGVFRRSGSAVFQWKKKAPKDLRHLYSSEWACRTSLGTTNLREANSKAAQLNAECEAEFSRLRRAKATAVDEITPELADRLVGQMVHDALKADELLRHQPAAREGFLEYLALAGEAPPVYPHGPLDGVPDHMAAALADRHRLHADEARKALSRGAYISALPAMQRAGQALGVLFSSDTPGFADAARRFLEARRDAFEAQMSRDRGDTIKTPELKSTRHFRLRDVFERWNQGDGSHVKPQTVRARELALELFEAQSGNPYVQNISSETGDSFRTWLIQNSSTSKTAHDRFLYVASLVKYAHALEWIPRNPWALIRNIPYTTENARRPWTIEELQKLFALPLFSEYVLPESQTRAGADAAYWLPVLAVFSGARLGELIQLLTSDIREDGSGWYFDFNKNDDKSLKTPSSVRSTPMHSEIVRLGFLDYVAARKAAGDIRLWPDLRPDSQRPSVQFSRWFREEIRRKANLPEFHALRHTVETRLVEARVHPEIRDRLLGHANRGSEGGRTYAHPREVLRSSMEQLAYPGLSIRRAYRSVHSSAQVEPL